MRCLLIDNYDSFSYILADYLGQTFGELPTVVYNDAYDWPTLCQTHRFDCIVISPGPGSVIKDGDFGLSRQAVAQNNIPVFGVCLGMQGIAHQHQGIIDYCPEPFHGRLSKVEHFNDPMFAHIPNHFDVVRYHSLMVRLGQHSDLIATAHSADGVIQALRHKSLPKWGVQFHPESILSEHGHQILTNFRDLAHQHIGHTQISVATPKPTAPTNPPICGKHIVSKKLNQPFAGQDIFSALFAEQPNVFWLDSQLLDSDHCSRFSFMGCAQSDEILRYRIAQDTVAFEQGRALFDTMAQQLEQKVVGAEVLPFSFVGGLVGYLGYEMKALFGSQQCHQSALPDMLWMHIDRFIALDHHTNALYLVACADEEQIDAATQWLNEVETQLLAIKPTPPAKSPAIDSLNITLDSSRKDYLAAIDACKSAIVEGDSYEVCLTNQFSFEQSLDPLALYLALREGNAAPFGAYIQFNGSAIISTSPERFLQVTSQGRIQAKPIKGTIGRDSDADKDQALAKQLSQSEKDRSENLMIVDLMRNDLSRVSKPASVKVPNLMDIESFKTVHQMVSTIESQLDDDKSLIDLIKMAFPGGSISGAPKLRTMAIIDKLERSARGPYCGAIGYLGYNKVADLNIGIRTLSYDGKTVRFGAGGAITYLSDAKGEFDEIMLKADALIKPIWQHLSGGKPFKSMLDGSHLKISK